jgi:enoyl-CoA hydratase/carnithine racemase
MKRARDLLFSARVVTAAEALQLGLAAGVVAPDKLMAECLRLAAIYEQNGPDAMASTKRFLAAQFRHKMSHELDLAVELNASARGTSECREGVEAFRLKRRPRWVYT